MKPKHSVKQFLDLAVVKICCGRAIDSTMTLTIIAHITIKINVKMKTMYVGQNLAKSLYFLLQVKINYMLH